MPPLGTGAMNHFLLGALVSRSARAEGAAWPLVSLTLATLALPEVDTWAGAAVILDVAA